jgi:hypothetical protein
MGTDATDEGRRPLALPDFDRALVAIVYLHKYDKISYHACPSFIEKLGREAVCVVRGQVDTRIQKFIAATEALCKHRFPSRPLLGRWRSIIQFQFVL